MNFIFYMIFKKSGTTTPFRVLLSLTLLLTFNEQLLPNTKHWTTYFGGESGDAISDLVVVENFIYITGTSSSINSISSPGAFQKNNAGASDAFIAKFDITGKRLWSTYYGGNGIDSAFSIAFDGQNIIIAGSTSSQNLLKTQGKIQNNYSGGASDGFIAAFRQDGNIAWETYYGGQFEDKVESIYSSDKKLFIAMTTNSPQLFLKEAIQLKLNGKTDGYIVKIEIEEFKIEFASYFGGEGDDKINDIIFSDYIYIFGTADSQNNISFNSKLKPAYGGGSSDCFIAKLDDSGELKWSEYFGDKGEDKGHSIEIDEDDNFIYIAGATSSIEGISTASASQKENAGGSDAFLAKLDEEGTLIYSTYFGGEGNDDARRIAIDKPNRLLLVGNTESKTNIATDDAFLDVLSGPSDAFIVRFNEFGKQFYGTYFGGIGEESSLALGLGMDNLPVFAGMTTSQDIATLDAFQRFNNGAGDGFITRFFGYRLLIIEVITELCIGQQFEIQFKTNMMLGGDNDFIAELSDKDGKFDEPREIGRIHENKPGLGKINAEIPNDIQPGNRYRIRIKAKGEDEFISPDNGVDIKILKTPHPKIVGESEVCANGKDVIYSVEDIGTLEYKWALENGTIINQNKNKIIVSFENVGKAKIKITVTEGSCSGEDNMEITVHPWKKAKLNEPSEVCENDPPIKLDGGNIEIGTYYIKRMQSDEWVESEIFNPATMGVGEHLIMFITGGEYVNCPDTAYQTIKVLDAPDKPEITVKDKMLISSSDIGNQWYLNGNIIPGAINKEYMPAESGRYSVKVKAENGCESEMSAIQDYYVDEDGPQLKAAPDRLNYTETCDDSIVKELKLGNAGDKVLQITNMEITGDDKESFIFLTRTEDIKIEPNPDAFEIVRIAFVPKSSGPKKAVLVIHSNSIHRDTIQIHLSGVSHKIYFEVNPKERVLDFGLVGATDNTTKTIEIKNSGNAALKIKVLDSVTKFKMQPIEPNVVLNNQTANIIIGYNGGITGTLVQDKLTLILLQEQCETKLSFIIKAQVISGNSGDVSFTISDVEANAGDEVNIVITLKGGNRLIAANINSLSAEFTFNSSVLVPTGETSQGWLEGSDRAVPVSFDLESDPQYINLKLRATLGNDSLTKLNLRNIKSRDNPINIKVQPGTFRLLDICRAGGARLVKFDKSADIVIAPNPILVSSNSIELNITLIENGWTQIVIMNNMGESVMTILDKYMDKGTHPLTFDISDIGSGSYFIWLRTPTINKTKSMVILK